MARLGRTIYHPTPLACFRIHAASQTIAAVGEADQRRTQLLAVLERHLPEFQRGHPGAAGVERAARFSIDANHALACALAGRHIAWRPLAAGFARLGPGGWRRFFRDSRIIERCLSRVQAIGVRQLLAGPASGERSRAASEWAERDRSSSEGAKRRTERPTYAGSRGQAPAVLAADEGR